MCDLPVPDSERLQDEVLHPALEPLEEFHGISQLEFSPPLYEAVDPDALDRFLECSTAVVTFDYLGATVQVDNDNNVSITSQRPD